MKDLPSRLKKYILGIITVSLSVVIYMVISYDVPDLSTLLLFIILSITIESLVVVIPGGGAVTVGYAVWLASMIITGPLGAAICSSLGVMLRYGSSSKEPTRHIFNTPFYKTLFNGAQSFISIGVPASIYYSFGMKIKDPLFYTNILPLVLTICIYLLLNTFIMTKLLSMLNNQSFKYMFIKNMKWLLPNCFVIASLGIFLSLLYLNYGAAIMLLFFGPLLLARHSFKLYLEMKQVYFETVYALTKTVEAKDPYTDGHSKRVAEYAEKIAKKMGINEMKIDTLKTAALLHDIGKIGISDNILNKPDKLTSEEFDVIKQHPSIGVEILSTVDFLKEVKEIILQHHEKYDGSGYPHGLRADEISIEAYILAVADAFDAMTSDRSYRKGMTREKAMKILHEDSATHFHPQVVKCFMEILQEDMSVLQNVTEQPLPHLTSS
ncbi:HD-GYP domain-containing protein [Alkaliphilus transvaalensis]|uniref:HD-GYP domain-containing protein n=1 Tax=Alkaliphilus transvaalensis TaxID=114628 RepID=UPI0006850360|nr:HD domain-containing phosphohydrolase [Alkaliphilus transvaalensis]